MKYIILITDLKILFMSIKDLKKINIKNYCYLLFLSNELFEILNTCFDVAQSIYN